MLASGAQHISNYVKDRGIPIFGSVNRRHNSAQKLVIDTLSFGHSISLRTVIIIVTIKRTNVEITSVHAVPSTEAHSKVNVIAECPLGISNILGAIVVIATVVAIVTVVSVIATNSIIFTLLPFIHFVRE